MKEIGEINVGNLVNKMLETEEHWIIVENYIEKIMKTKEEAEKSRQKDWR